MKTNNHSEIGWHMILGAIVFLMLVPIVFALSNSFKTLQDAFNTIFDPAIRSTHRLLRR